MPERKRHANWDFALSVLAAVLPGSTAFSHDRIVGIPPGAWELFDIEERDADVIEDDFLSRCSGLIGPLIVVNDLSFDLDQGPYFVDASQFPGFVKNFHSKIRDYFMHASLFVISPATGIVIIVQDDGYFVPVQGRSVMTTDCTFRPA